MREVVDIVDENNQLTGEVRSRAEAHELGLWHRTVHIYVFRRCANGQIEILTHQRSTRKDLSPGKWDARFGGHVHAGSDIETAAIRELKEEIGLNVSFSSLIEGATRKRENPPNNEFTKVFYSEQQCNAGDLSFHDGEVRKVQWMLSEEAEHQMIEHPENWAGNAAAFREIMKFLLNYLRSHSMI